MREKGLLLRANPWSEGDGLALALARGATAGDLDEFYGRNMPDVDELAEEDYVRSSQLYAQYAHVVDEGRDFVETPFLWSENDVAQATARQPDGRAWYLLTEKALRQKVRNLTVSDMVDAAEPVSPEQLPVQGSAQHRGPVPVRAAVTHTIGGIRIDERTRVLDANGRPIDGLLAAGVDAGGWSTGGFAGGLGPALVLGRVAAESALA